MKGPIRFASRDDRLLVMLRPQKVSIRQARAWGWEVLNVDEFGPLTPRSAAVPADDVIRRLEDQIARFPDHPGCPDWPRQIAYLREVQRDHAEGKMVRYLYGFGRIKGGGR
jgi:hypothetical protein